MRESIEHSVLLDTHIFIWLIEEDKRLNKRNLEAIESCLNSKGRVFLSAISIFEIAMMVKKGKLKIEQPVLDWIKNNVEVEIEILPLLPQILVYSCNLSGDFHKDPMDRMIVSTSIFYNISLITQDKEILTYLEQNDL